MYEYKFVVTVKHKKKLNKRELAQDIKANIYGIYPYDLHGNDQAEIKNVSVRCISQEI